MNRRRRKSNDFELEISGDTFNGGEVSASVIKIEGPVKSGIIYLQMWLGPDYFEIGFPASIAHDVAAEIMSIAAVINKVDDTGVS